MHVGQRGVGTETHRTGRRMDQKLLLSPSSVFPLTSAASACGEFIQVSAS